VGPQVLLTVFQANGDVGRLLRTPPNVKIVAESLLPIVATDGPIAGSLTLKLSIGLIVGL
jgi:hypothetical protein